MKLQCPRADKARKKNCHDIGKDGSCLRKEWGGISYFKEKGPDSVAKVEVYCERITVALREQ